MSIGGPPARTRLHQSYGTPVTRVAGSSYSRHHGCCRPLYRSVSGGRRILCGVVWYVRVDEFRLLALDAVMLTQMNLTRGRILVVGEFAYRCSSPTFRCLCVGMLARSIMLLKVIKRSRSEGILIDLLDPEVVQARDEALLLCSSTGLLLNAC